MTVSQIGQVGEFILAKEDWTQYVECLEHFFLANDIEATNKKRAVYLLALKHHVLQIAKSGISRKVEQYSISRSNRCHEETHKPYVIRDSAAIQIQQLFETTAFQLTCLID